MGLLDKAKFWKKQDEDLGDLSDLGDFGLDEKPGAPGGDKGLGGGLDEGFGDFPPLDESEKPGMRPGVPTHMEEVQPTQASRDMGESLGLKPAGEEAGFPTQTAARPQAAPARAASPPQQQYPQYQQQYPQQYQQGPDLTDLAKEIEIVHAKLDAIRSSLDSINQRLATLERMASGDTGKTRYTW
ncbi:MAG: hypothetical protein KKD17_03545 [Nanoarchaeota archaeon]|nr:hypothetical protein [Nanoarchaeota archaeon]